MITPFRIVAAAGVLLVTGLFTTMGHAQNASWQVLRDDPVIHEGLTVIAVGRQIQSVCDDISPRLMRALGFAEGLGDRGLELGVPRRDIHAFIDDRGEQQRYREVMHAWFAARGVDHRDPEAVCRVGRDEITAGTQIGRLLR
ncbi:DUF5333 domain-containing protein [Rhodobacteraceae bacterium N5(2021)]|uniref:DUF5333 domain-containing protein n=1 Tax=Gymnodinialimonas phycosphaerae TaxID=2841589 RepID=A0A975TUR5_9RHOB|nr:DUF5333 domain-containing protein [Gymnodinialimonas phycosphaerae]MBY4895209.1 DUF5333 domain-containing protein [Gymnodinialimonas phycosphaerae]